MMTDTEFAAFIETAPPNLNIQKYLMVTRNKLKQYERIAVSYSGGSDSDVMLDLIELVKPSSCGEIRYVFFDTGLEWDAIHRHVAEVEEKYGVTIEKRKAKMPIPIACNVHGIPYLNKTVSEKLYTMQNNQFDFNFEGCGLEHVKATHIWWTRSAGEWDGGQYVLDPRLKSFLVRYPPKFKVSKKYCEMVKKRPAKIFYKEFMPDLEIMGLRKAEGGARMSAYKNCFTVPGDSLTKPFGQYRPLWFWTDADKQLFKEWRGITYSDCYEKWGFKRTGCVGCPCASKSVEQLEIARPYEPQKVKAAYAVFGKSYAYREQYNLYKAKKDIEATGQTTLEASNATESPAN